MENTSDNNFIYAEALKTYEMKRNRVEGLLKKQTKKLKELKKICKENNLFNTNKDTFIEYLNTKEFVSKLNEELKIINKNISNYKK